MIEPHREQKGLRERDYGDWCIVPLRDDDSVPLSRLISYKEERILNMNIYSSRLGSIEIDPERVIYFKEGLPGFEFLNEFIILSPPELEPFHLLQSTEDGDVGLIISDPFLFKEDYAPLIKEEIFKALEIDHDDQAGIFTIVTIPEDYRNMTANLMAPIIINPEKRLGMQVILDKEDYPIRYPILKETAGRM